LNVGVEDSRGRNIKGLTAGDFKLYEDGRPQMIKQFSSEERPVTIGIVVDASGSMRTKQSEAVQAALSFVDASNPADEIFVVNFNDEAKLGLPAEVPFTHDPRQIRRALLDKRPEGRTALYDAISIAVNHIRTGKWEKKALLLVSDGGDNNSTHSLAEALMEIQASGVMAYTIGLFDETDPNRNLGVLRRLSRMSGGQAFFPMELSGIDSLCRRIAENIRAGYTLAYTPPNPDQHTLIRKLKVVATTPGRKPIVRTRASYLLVPRWSK